MRERQRGDGSPNVDSERDASLTPVLELMHVRSVNRVSHSKEPAVQDRHLADSWVVPWGPGMRSDLVVEWEGFKAARAALAGTTSPAAAREQVGTLKRVLLARYLR